MPRRHPVPRPHGFATEAGRADVPLPDSVDRIVLEWATERPDLRVAPVEVLTRLARVRTRMDEELATVFALYDLSAADFTVIAALRRAGTPFTLPQSVLMSRLGLTSGTVSVRLSRLEAKGAVRRSPSDTDNRGVQVSLTDRGAELFDQVAPQHLANEDVLLSALDGAERAQLAGLLRKLLVAFEHETWHSPAGFTVAPAHVARRARVAVGLSDRAGLLVRQVDPGSAADAAGLMSGDLLVGVAGKELRSCVDLAATSAAAEKAGTPLRLRVMRGERDRDLELALRPPA